MSSPRAVHHLLLSLLAISLSCSSAALPPVYDTDGHELSADASYYVLPAVRGRGGGLTMATRVLPCPLFVAQETNELRRGFPVRFTPLQGGGAASSDRTVRVSFDVRIHFDAVTTCVQTTEWYVGDEPLSGRRLVVTGPVLAPSPSGREKVFRVEKHGRGYKLVSCRDSCQDLGVFRDVGDVWFGASDPAHVVVFKKAPSV
ncbi:alpha-amylase/subtilisin inhibitor-like [Phragmites australis]|uniref:alpha-amylase/subtilisin inhibitor-like n=1 Tax=Phragmites australis TaxID=29695 RepID=UPI002D76D15D|nr:alpha-amylase/subtilisin inhibitor-like [Phragmites australis]